MSIPTSTFSFKSFLVFATFSASKIVPTLMSNFVKSSNSIVSFCGAVTLFSCSFAILVAANFSTCASISLSSILEIIIQLYLFGVLLAIKLWKPFSYIFQPKLAFFGSRRSILDNFCCS